MSSKKRNSLQAVVRALGDQGLTAKQIQEVASRIGDLSLEEIEMLLFKRDRQPAEPKPEAKSELVALVAQLRTASRRRTNADVVALLADELEEAGLIDNAQHAQHVKGETVAQWLARVGKQIDERKLSECIETLLGAYKSGVRLRRIK